jgi:hypothetical protein
MSSTPINRSEDVSCPMEAFSLFTSLHMVQSNTLTRLHCIHDLGMKYTVVFTTSQIVENIFALLSHPC